MEDRINEFEEWLSENIYVEIEKKHENYREIAIAIYVQLQFKKKWKKEKKNFVWRENSLKSVKIYETLQTTIKNEYEWKAL
jgi:hypothetical protein